MTKEEASFAETHKSIADAEKQALMLKAMLNRLDSKLDSLLDEINGESEGVTDAEKTETENKTGTS